MTQITVLDSTGATQTVAKVANTGSTTDANSLPVTQSTEDKAVLAATNVLLTAIQAILGNGNGRVSLAGNAAQSVLGITAKTTPFGALQVAGATTKLLQDSFETALDTTNVWTTSGTVTPANSAGECVMSLGAVNSASSVLVSQQNFIPTLQPLQNAVQLSLGIQQTNPNCHRFYGAGTASSYAAATPLTEGFGFEVDITGALNAVVYIAGTRYVVNSTNPALITPSGSWATDMSMSTYGQTMTWPVSGRAIISMQNFNGYVLFYMANLATGFDIPIGIASYVPGAVALPIRAAAITTPAVSTVLATTFKLSSLVLGTINGTDNTVADPNYPWRKQQVDASGRALQITPELTATGNITTQNLVPAGVATAASAVELTTNGFPTLMIQTTGTYTGALSLQATVDGTTWVTMGGLPLLNVNTGGYLASITSALASVFQADVAGAIKVRVTALAAVTGTAVVTLRAVPSAAMVALDAALPTGANTIGAVNIAAAQTLATVTTVGTVTSVTAVASSTPVTPTTTFTNSAATTNATVTKASAGTLWSVVVSNINAAARFLKLYNKATAPTVGTDVPVMTIPIPIGGVVNIDGGANGIRFATGISWALTALAADTDTTAVAASEHKVAMTFT